MLAITVCRLLSDARDNPPHRDVGPRLEAGTFLEKSPIAVVDRSKVHPASRPTMARAVGITHERTLACQSPPLESDQATLALLISRR